MKLIKTAALAGFGATLMAISSIAGAAAVSCGPSDGRNMVVDPALVGGVCYFQSGNLQAADYPLIGVDGLVEIEKDVGGAGQGDGSLFYTIDGTGSGTWEIAASLWSTYSQLFLGAHFGNGSGDPDSFVVELAATDTSGTYELTAPAGMDLNGLSNLYLFGVPGGDTQVPEPASLALLGLGLAGLGFARRRRT
jgi:hypothetical protein